MTALLAEQAGWVLALVAFLSCLALPIPTSALMVGAGGLVAAGELSWALALGAPLVGAVLGDQLGYTLGRRGGPGIAAWLARRPGRARLAARAKAMIARRGGLAVFLTRWLLAPLGPYANFACGVAGMGWARFSLAAVAGKALWVGLYVGVGHAVAGNVAAASRAIGPGLGLLAGAVILIGLAVWLHPLRLRRQ